MAAHPTSSKQVKSGSQSTPAARKSRDRLSTCSDRSFALPRSEDLRSLLDAHVAASPHVRSSIADPVFETLLRAACFQEERIIVVCVRLRTKAVTIVAVPADVWEVGVRRARILALKHAAVRAGRRVVLIPEGALLRQPRLGNACLMAGAADVGIGAEDRIAVMSALVEEPGMALGDLIQVVQHEPDRVAAVLSLARSGILEVDMRKAIGPQSPIWLCTG